jgi:hypothetical protein
MPFGEPVSLLAASILLPGISVAAKWTVQFLNRELFVDSGTSQNLHRQQHSRRILKRRFALDCEDS